MPCSRSFSATWWQRCRSVCEARPQGRCGIAEKCSNIASIARVAICNRARARSSSRITVERDGFLPESLNKRRILDYLKAAYAGDIERAGAYYDDDIDFIGYAPINVFPSLGHQFGKAALVLSLERMHALYRLIEYDVVSIVAEDNRVAAMLDMCMHIRNGDRIVRLPFANFYTLRQGRIYIFRQFMDSFDAVQQKLRIDLIEQMKEEV